MQFTKRLVAVVAALCAVASSHAADGDILIGQSVPLSGPLADVGRDMRDGAAAWFAYEASQHPNLKPIKLLTLDNVNDKARAAENGQMLVRNPAVVAMFGFSSATVSQAPYEEAEKAGMLFYAPFTGSNVLRDRKNFYSFRASYQDEASRIEKQMSTIGATRAEVLYYDDEVGKSNFAAVSAALQAAGAPAPKGLAVPRKGQVGPTAFDAVFNDRPHYVIATTRHDRVVELLQAAKSKGQSVSVAALSFVNPDELGAVEGDLARGTVVSQVVPTPTLANVTQMAALRDCAQAFKAFASADLNYTRLESCLAARVLGQAVRKAGAAPTREGTLAAMAALGKLDLGGVNLDYSGGRHHGGQFVELTVLARGNRFVR